MNTPKIYTRNVYWVREQHESPCIHTPAVDDLGNFICADCPTFFDNEGFSNNKGLVQALKLRYDLFWKKELKKLRRVRSLVLNEQFDQLVPVLYCEFDESDRFPHEACIDYAGMTLKCKRLKKFYELAA